jgi:general secretion pathway protein B
MSFILDALKKSEAERQRQAGPALLEMRVVRPQRRIPPWVLVIGGALILLNLMGMLWLFLRPAAHTAATASPVAASGAPGAAPATRVVNGTGTGGDAAGGTPLLAPGEQLIGPGGVASTVTQVPLLAGDSGAGQTAGAAPANGATNGPYAGTSGADGTAAESDVNPADYVPAGPATTRSRTAGLRTYNDVSNQVPPMRLDLHVYDAVPARRYAFINMRKVHEGDVSGDGTRVVEITRDAVVLDYRSIEFVLTSDSSAPASGAAP